MRTSDLVDALKLEGEAASLDVLAQVVARASEDPPHGPIRPTATAGEALQTIAVSCLCRFGRNRELLARSCEAEALHHARVALRQLRSALAVFKPIAGDDRFTYLHSELRWLAGSMNDARDLDVLIARIGQPPRPLAAARERACARASETLASERGQRVVRELVEWLASGPWLDKIVDEPAPRFAEAALDRLRRKLRKKGRHLRELDDEALHEVRIAAKKLRYAVEFFASLFPSDKAQRRAKRLAKSLRALQDELGELHDKAIAPATLAHLHVPRESWPTLPERDELVERADARFEQVFERKPFWR